MMYKKLVALRSDLHGRMRFTPPSTSQFAETEIQTPLLAEEIGKAADAFPIVFQSETTPLPIAVLGLKDSVSHFVDTEGNWTAPYMPNSFSHYPFKLVKRGSETAGAEGNYVVTFDEESPFIQEDNGKLLYNKSGKAGLRPSPLLKEIMEQLSDHQRKLEQTLAFFQPLVDHKVLVQQKINIGSGEKPFTIGGTAGIDLEALKKLDDKVLAEWVRSGLMDAITLQRNSMRHFAPMLTAQFSEDTTPEQQAG